MKNHSYEERFIREVVIPNCVVPIGTETEEFSAICFHTIATYEVIKRIGEGCKSVEQIITKKAKEMKKRNPQVKFRLSGDLTSEVSENYKNKIELGLRINEDGGLIEKADEYFRLTDRGSEYYKNLNSSNLIPEIRIYVNPLAENEETVGKSRYIDYFSAQTQKLEVKT